jgi:hypothetical protein
MLAWAGLTFVVLFLLANIETTESGVGYHFLLLAVVAAAAIAATIGNPLRSICFPRSALFLLGFLTYFLLRLFFDVPYLAEVKAITVGTSGGIVFALGLGLIVSIFVATIFSAQSLGIRGALPGFLFLCLTLYFVVDTFMTHFATVRSDLFLIDSDERQYQRPGNFIVILSLIFSMLLGSVRVFHDRLSKTPVAAKFVIVGIYLVMMGMLVVMAQLLGSNAGFFVGVLICGTTLLWIWRPRHRTLHWSRFLLARSNDSADAFRDSVPSLAGRGVFLGLVALVAVAFGLSFTEFELQQFRFFGFGEGRIGGNSIASRLRILSTDFLTQFAYSPMFGNLLADERTTGGGTYAHSLISLLSHVGVIGTFLFALYFVAVFRDIGRVSGMFGSYFNNLDIGVLRIMLLVIVALFALAATFFTWMPLWFTLGLVCPPILLQNHLFTQAK